MTSVSSQGSKKGRGKRRGAAKGKNLNLGQNIGDGKMQVVWPGLNANVFERGDRAAQVTKIQVIGEDINREKKLVEMRNQMDKFRRITIPPHERGFSGSNMEGKSIGEPVSYDDGNDCFHFIFSINIFKT